MSVPTNLIPTTITKLPEYEGTSKEGFLPYAVNGRTWKARIEVLTPGPPGPQGVSGPQGDIGPVGPPGATGPIGSKGDPGPTGAGGPVGPVGPAGPQGITGGAGPNGAAGAPGPQGVKGDKGDQGNPGIPGSQGPAGPQGVAGVNGATGATGPMGATGLTGAPGPDGKPGPVGPVGPQGDPGQIGDIIAQRKEFTAAGGEVVFQTPQPYVVGFVGVYVNGVRLADSEYAATDGVHVVLNTPVLANDTVLLEAFLGSPVNPVFTPASIPFAGSGGNLAEDNANLNWDDTVHALNVGGQAGIRLSYPVKAGPALQVGGDLSLFAPPAGGDGGLHFNGYYDGTTLRTNLAGFAGAVGFTHSTGAIGFWTCPAGVAAGAASGLRQAGSFDLNLNFSVVGAQMSVGNGNALWQHDGSNGYFRTQTGHLYLGAGGNNWGVISSGNVWGIGYWSPRAGCHVMLGDGSSTVLGSVAGATLLLSRNADNSYGLCARVRSDGAVAMQVQRFDGSTAVYPMLLQPGGGGVGIGVIPSTEFHVNGIASISAPNGNQLLLKNGVTSAVSAIHRVDGSNYYILLSDPTAGAPNGGWNNLRPFTINLASGALSSANGQTFTGGLTCGSNLIVNGGGGQITLATNGDVTADRGNGTGVFAFGAASRYLYYDGGTYILNGAPLSVGGICYSQLFSVSNTGVSAGIRCVNNNVGHDFRLIAKDDACIWITNETQGIAYIGCQHTGGIRMNQPVITNLTVNGGGGNIALRNNGDIACDRGNDTGVIFFGTAGSHYLYWDGTNYNMPGGGLTVSGNIAAFSDERLKINWRAPVDDFVTKLAGVRSGIYERTDLDHEPTQCGVGAQSLQAVLPEAVYANDEGMLSVNYGGAAMMAVVELAKEVVALRAELAALRREVRS